MKLLVAIVIGLALGAWTTMIGMGIIHSVFPVIPAIGFRDSFFLNLGIGLLIGPHLVVVKD